MLGEDELPVDEDVELAVTARCGFRGGDRLGLDLGRETRGPCVVAASGRTVEDLDRLCLDTMARYKRPRAYFFVDSLPKNNYGKVLKTTLRQQLDIAGASSHS